MAIARLMHLHLIIPVSGSVLEPVPEECYPAVPLPRVSVLSRWPLFAREVVVIESAPLLCSKVRTLDSLIEPATRDPEPLDQCLI